MSLYFSPRKSLRTDPRTISLEQPWDPVDSRGKTVTIYRAYEALVDKKSEPPCHDRSWARSNFWNVFKSYPEAEGAIWENIVALWRLETLQDHSYSEVWKHHAMSWLVSYDLLIRLGPSDHLAGRTAMLTYAS